MPKAFIPAITGAQSAAIATTLRTAGWAVEGHSRKDGGDPAARLAGSDALILTIPQDHRPGAMTGFIAGWTDRALAAGVGRIVLNVGGAPGPADASPFFADLHAAEARVAGSGLPFVILRPTVYLDNLTQPWAAASLAGGVIAYPAVATAAISWMSHRTLGEWVAAVAGGGADGRTLHIGGPAALTGDELADAFGTVLGRALSYVQIPAADFAAGLNAAMGAPAGDRLAAIYTRLADYPDAMRVDPAVAAAFGIRPETAGAFAARLLR